MSCFPLVECSICETQVLLNSDAGDAVLSVRKGSNAVCSYDISDNFGDFFLTDTQILDFADIAHIYTLQLKLDGVIVPILYYDCTNIQVSADAVRVRFTDCINSNLGVFNEVCF